MVDWWSGGGVVLKRWWNGGGVVGPPPPPPHDPPSQSLQSRTPPPPSHGPGARVPKCNLVMFFFSFLGDCHNRKNVTVPRKHKAFIYFEFENLEKM